VAKGNVEGILTVNPGEKPDAEVMYLDPYEQYSVPLRGSWLEQCPEMQVVVEIPMPSGPVTVRETGSIAPGKRCTISQHEVDKAIKFHQQSTGSG